jgi:hypothetical protein
MCLDENVGRGHNWFLIFPNLFEIWTDDGSHYYSAAIKLGQGVAVSWDGRVICHGTSLSKPDGVDGYMVNAGRCSENHLYGSFTAAKSRVVAAGRSNYEDPEAVKA